MEKRPAGWKQLYLSKGDVITLIKSTISNMPASRCGSLHWKVMARLVNAILLNGIKCVKFKALGMWLRLWRRVVEKKYNTLWGGWWINVVNGEIVEEYGTLWKHIHRDWENFFLFIKFEVGDDTKVRFWYEIWCGDLLKDIRT